MTSGVDVGDQLGVRILQILRAFARGELEPFGISEMAVVVVGRNEVAEVVVALRRVQGGELRLREVDRRSLGIIRPGFDPNLDVRVGPTHKGENVGFELL